MKLSKTPPINQACQGIDFPSSLPSSLSLPAPLHPEASDVSRCKTNVARRVKDDGVTLNSKTSPFLPETCFPPATPGIVGAVKGVQSGLPPPFLLRTARDGAAQLPHPHSYGRHDFPHNEIFTGQWFPEQRRGSVNCFSASHFPPSDFRALRVDSH